MIKFGHSYGWEILSYVPEGKQFLWFPEEPRYYSLGYLVEVIPPLKDPWIGNFLGSGFDIEPTVNSTPKDTVMCINAYGAVYLVDVNSPSNFVLIPFMPVIEIISSVDNEYMLFIGFTKISLYTGQNELTWTKEVSSDGIKVVKLEKEKIIGKAWDPSKDNFVDFEIETHTGNLTGGSVF